MQPLPAFGASTPGPLVDVPAFAAAQVQMRPTLRANPRSSHIFMAAFPAAQDGVASGCGRQR